MTKVEVLHKVQDILEASADDPADDMIRMGQVLIEIGKALKGRPVHEARAIIEAVRLVA